MLAGPDGMAAVVAAPPVRRAPNAFRRREDSTGSGSFIRGFAAEQGTRELRSRRRRSA
jgi:hypothetical protein